VQLQRLVLTFDRGLTVRVLYKRQDGPGPSTRARRREVAALARTGLESALEALEEGPVESVGTSGFETREDVLSLQLASPASGQTVKGGRGPSRCRNRRSWAAWATSRIRAAWGVGEA